MFPGKKGLSDVVSTVLIILLVVAALAVIGVIVLNVVNVSKTKVEVASACQSIEASAVKCEFNSLNTYSEFNVKKNKDITISNLSLVFDDNFATTTKSIDLSKVNDVDKLSYVLYGSGGSNNSQKKFFVTLKVKVSNGNSYECPVLSKVNCNFVTTDIPSVDSPGALDSLGEGIREQSGNPLNYTVRAISSCQNLNQANSLYQLTTDINNTQSDCFIITADNITLDGQGHTIDAYSSNDYVLDHPNFGSNDIDTLTGDFGDYAESESIPSYFYNKFAYTAVKSTGYSNITVSNLKITDFRDGIKFEGQGSNLKVKKTNIDRAEKGISFLPTSNDLFSANGIQITATNIKSHGKAIYFERASNNVSIRGNNINSSAGTGIDISSTNGSLFEANNIDSFGVGIKISNSASYFNNSNILSNILSTHKLTKAFNAKIDYTNSSNDYADYKKSDSANGGGIQIGSNIRNVKINNNKFTLIDSSAVCLENNRNANQLIIDYNDIKTLNSPGIDLESFNFNIGSISNNMISSGSSAIQFGTSINSVIVSGNTINAGDRAIYSSSSTGNNLTISNNNIISNTSTIYFENILTNLLLTNNHLFASMHDVTNLPGQSQVIVSGNGYYSTAFSGLNNIVQSDIVKDSSVNHNNGTITNTDGIKRLDGKLGKSYYFDGNTNIEVPESSVSSNIEATNKITIGAWVNAQDWKYHYRNDASGVITIYQNKTRTILNVGEVRLGSDNGLLKFNAGESLEITTPLPSQEQWHFVVATYGDNSLNIYVDGALVKSLSQSGAVSLSGGSLFIGNGNNYFAGSIDEVSLWNRTLSQSEVTSYYNSGSGSSLIGNENGLVALYKFD